jgi:hypothetical protein
MGLSPQQDAADRRTEPGWFHVIGGPPPLDVLLRDLLIAISVPLLVLLGSLWLSGAARFFCVVGALGLAVGLSMLLRERWRRRQGVRVIGSVLEYRNGVEVRRVALPRAVVSAVASPPSMLVLVIDDGRTNLAVGRRAQAHEISDLPPRLVSYVELEPEDFEEVRIAAHRSYPMA